MKVALVYDRINKFGGAERVLLALHKLFPHAPLYTSVHHPQKAQWSSVFRIHTSFLQNLPKAKESHELYALLMPIAFESFSFNEYDLVISVTSESAKGIITSPKTFHLCYCLTPTRYIWSGYKEYFTNSLFQGLSKPAVNYLRKWDLIAAQRPSAFIAISKHVQLRIQQYYKRDASVVYPPVEFPFLREQDKSISLLKRNHFFLVVSRLVAYKRIDIVVQACNILGMPLKVIGSGVEEMRLKKLAGKTIEFLGNLTDEQLVEYYKHCKALIFPGEDDFGLVPLEAQRFGKPVIAYKAGGALETVIEGKTGLFFWPQTVDSLVKVLRDFNEKQFAASACIQNADRFSTHFFKNQFIRQINAFMK